MRIDPFGYAVVPQSVPYRVNSVALNPQDFDTFLDVPNAVADTVPTRGAITRVRFDTFRGYSVLIHTTLADGSYPPLGAQLYRASGSAMVWSAREEKFTSAESIQAKSCR